jgi:hypothetical protein
MSLVFLPDRQLYSSYHHFGQHFTWPPATSADASRRLLYHAYWQGALTWQHELCLKSLMLTQSAPYEIWLWMRPEWCEHNRPFVDRLHSPQLRVQACEAETLTRGTAFEGVAERIWHRPPAPVSDIVRTLVLRQYGGIYFDLDMLFLRDVRPLTRVEFFYQWSDQPYGNSAMSHFRSDSTNMRALAERGKQLGTCHPKRLLWFDDLDAVVDDVYVMPSFVFDPAWIPHDRLEPINDYCLKFMDFFEKTFEHERFSLRTFYPYSYTYHWHNGWGRALIDTSIAGQLYREVCDAVVA